MLGQRIHHIADQPRRVAVFQQGRHFAHTDRAGAESFQHQPQTFKHRRGFDQSRHLALVHVDNHGDQQALPGNAAGFALAFQLFIDQPLMGGVLVHQDQAIARLGDDIGLMHLRPRGTERRIGNFNGGCLKPCSRFRKAVETGR